jgi:RHS repeat-associated protein
VLQATDYYAFGLEHTPLAISNANRYLYNGKELQDETFAGGVRLGWYGYGWRFYDPMIGRFTNVDPMAEKFYAWSSHSYGQDNPVGNIDVGGRFVFKDASNYPELARVLQNIQSVLDNQNIMSNL